MSHIEKVKGWLHFDSSILEKVLSKKDSMMNTSAITAVTANNVLNNVSDVELIAIRHIHIYWIAYHLLETLQV